MATCCDRCYAALWLCITFSLKESWRQKIAYQPSISRIFFAALRREFRWTVRRDNVEKRSNFDNVEWISHILCAWKPPSRRATLITMRPGEEIVAWEQERLTNFRGENFSFCVVLCWNSLIKMFHKNQNSGRQANYLQMSLSWSSRGDLGIECILHPAADWSPALRTLRCRFWVESGKKAKQTHKKWLANWKIFLLEVIGQSMALNWIISSCGNSARSLFSRLSLANVKSS